MRLEHDAAAPPQSEPETMRRVPQEFPRSPVRWAVAYMKPAMMAVVWAMANFDARPIMPLSFFHGLMAFSVSKTVAPHAVAPHAVNFACVSA